MGTWSAASAMTELAKCEVSDGVEDARVLEAVSGEATVLKVTGDVDIATSHDLLSELESLLQAGRVRVVVDMEAVEFIDASGVGILVDAAQKATARGGELTIRRPGTRVLRVFDLLQLDGDLPVEGRSEEASGQRPG